MYTYGRQVVSSVVFHAGRLEPYKLLSSLFCRQLCWRHDDVATSNYAFYHGIGADLGLSDPIHQKRLAEDGIHPEKQPNEAGAKWIDKVWHGRVHSWEKMPWLMKTWKEISGRKPFGIKSI